MQNQLSILVLAASGKTGRRVADRLAAQGHAVRRASRSGDTRFDWDDRSTWASALDGVDAAYVVYTPDLAVPAAAGAITEFVKIAKAQGVRRLVLLSGRGEVEAQRCERIVQESGLEWTIVRASWFAQNFDEGPFAELVLAGEVTLPVADGVVEPFLDVEDIADVAVAALTSAGHAGEVYEVTGPRLMRFDEAVADIAAATGRELRFVPIPMEAFRAGLDEAGVPAELADLYEYLFTTVLDGRNAHVTDGVQRALGRPARDFREYAREAAARGAWDVSLARATTADTNV
ncbi:MAG: NAD(P)H-binding protein [Planctomycetes bacterium]|nr:NAD(P)H-binding protein [Planctomycetota bacterium]